MRVSRACEDLDPALDPSDDPHSHFCRRICNGLLVIATFVPFDFLFSHQMQIMCC
jgi:hypothetical protein